MTEYKCDYCEDIKWVRVERGVFEEGFGRLEPCPKCNKAITQIVNEKLEEKSGPTQEPLFWEDKFN